MVLPGWFPFLRWAMAMASERPGGTAPSPVLLMFVLNILMVTYFSSLGKCEQGGMRKQAHRGRISLLIPG